MSIASQLVARSHRRRYFAERIRNGLTHELFLQLFAEYTVSRMDGVRIAR